MSIGTVSVRVIPNMAGFGATVGAAVAGSYSGFARAGAAASVMFTAPIVAGIATGIRSAVNFETAFAEVEKTVSGTPVEIENIRQGLVDMANVLPFTREQLADTAAAAGRFGVANEDILRMTELASQLGVATGVAPDQITQQLVRLSSVLGVGFEEMELFASSVVALGNDLPTTEQEILTMAQRLGQISAVAPVSSADVLGMSGAMSSLGIRAQMGGSAMARVFFNLSSLTKSGGKDMDEFADRWGLNAERFTQAWEKDPVSAVTMFLEKIKEAGDAGKDVPKMLKDSGLGEIRVRDTLLRTSEGIDVWKKSIDLANTSYEDGTALQEEFSKKADTTAAKWQVLKNKASNTARIFGEALLPMLLDTFDAITPLAEAIAGMAEAFGKLPDPMRRVIMGGLLAVAALGPLVFIGSRVVGMFRTMGVALTLLRAAAMGHPVLLLLAAIALAAFVIYKNWDKIWPKLQEFWNLLKGWAEETWNWLVEKWGGLADWFQEQWDKATAVFNTAKDNVAGILSSIVSEVGDWANPIADSVLILWGEVSGQNTEGYEGMTGLFSLLSTNVIAAFNTTKDQVVRVWNNQWDAISLKAQISYNYVRDNVITPLSVITMPLLSRAAELMGVAWSVTWSQMSTAAAVGQVGIGIALDSVKGYITGAWDTMSSFYNDFKAKWQALPTFVQAAVEAIKRAIEQLKQAINEAVSAISRLPTGIPSAVGGGLSGILKGSITYGSNLLKRHDGGLVPGLRGQEVPIMAMAGETVLPTHKPGFQMGGSVIHIGGFHLQVTESVSEAKFAEMLEKGSLEVVRVIRRELDRNSRGAGGSEVLSWI